MDAALRVLTKAPAIEAEARFFWNAYQELSADRPPAFSGMSPIPLTAILTFAHHLEMTRREADEFMRIIRTLDTRNLVLVNDKRAAQAKKTPGNG